MKIPTKESLDTLTNELLEKDYLEEPERVITSKVEFPEQTPAGVSRDKVVRILKSNYAEPTKEMQKIYETQFRSFSKKNDTDDSFESIL